MTKTITARRLITGIGEIEFPVIDLAADGTIAGISSDPIALAKEEEMLTAAFLDVHTHGAVGVDVMSATAADLSKLGRFYAQHGVAHYLPTTVTASIDDTLRALEGLADACELAATAEAGLEAQPIGIHLEGPFLSHAKRGVHPAALLQPPSIELFDRFWQAARGYIRLMTLAPETNGALDLIRHAAALGVRISVGHSNALAAETLAAIDAGAASATHTFNAMRALDHREPGIAGVVLDDDRLYAELICDGIHVTPEFVRLWFRSKGQERAILVTDAMSAAGMPDGHYTLAGQDVIVENHRAVISNDIRTLAGSLLTMDSAVANLQAFSHTTLATATHCASHTPAAMLGRPELTRLAPGDAANLNRFDAKGKLIATCLRGRSIPNL